MTFKPNRIPLLLLVATVFFKESSAELSWWQKSVFYQIYPRSYQDTDGDGIGDIQGIIEHVEYLKDLGINGIWMNPIYDSPLKDFGYDISNYERIDKTFGTFADFDALVEKLHSLDMYILVDIVPNHSSNEHMWFQESKKGNPIYKDYYVWHDGIPQASGKNAVPNNWTSVFGGPAWQWDEERKQYYYHAFLSAQPDLNYRNPAVVEEMKNILKFWLDRGVDGFRVDAVIYLIEDDQFRNEDYNSDCEPSKSPDCLNHIYTQNQNGTYDLLAQLYEVFQNYTNPKFPGEKFMVTEVYGDTKTLQYYYEFDGKKTASMPFNFQLMNVNMETNGTQIKNMVDSWTENLTSGRWSNWVIGNHDQNRVGHKVGVPLTDGMNMIVLLLPGTSFTYYGEELGMDDTYVDCFQMRDIQAIQQAGTDCGRLESLSRDLERTPMLWNNSLNAGFSNHEPWLPVNPDYHEINVEAQKMDSRSHLNIYKQLIALKQKMVECKEMKTLAPAEGWIFAFERSNCKKAGDKYLVLVNFSDEEKKVDLSLDFGAENKQVMSSSRNSNKRPGEDVSLSNLTLRPKEGLVLATSS